MKSSQIPPVQPHLRNFGGLIWGPSRGPTGQFNTNLERGRSEFSKMVLHAPLAQQEVVKNQGQKCQKRVFRHFCMAKKDVTRGG